ncbi:MAG: hypothetical protein JSS64_12125 [Bacteroidetes bacterium]|nr:hypothetical protein [Bacteroidota bacterium]
MNRHNVDRYIHEFGSERFAGYCDALRDFISQIDGLLQSPERINSMQVVGTALKKFHVNEQELLEFLKITYATHLIPNSNTTKIDTK